MFPDAPGQEECQSGKGEDRDEREKILDVYGFSFAMTVEIKEYRPREVGD